LEILLLLATSADFKSKASYSTQKFREAFLPMDLTTCLLGYVLSRTCPLSLRTTELLPSHTAPNRNAGYAACFFLIITGIFSTALTAILASVLGRMITFFFVTIAVSGARIIATVPFTCRTRFILTAALSLGLDNLSAELVCGFPYYFPLRAAS
jgi:hypothetical protein